MMISNQLEAVQCICCPTPKRVEAPFDGAVRSILHALKAEFGASLRGVLITGKHALLASQLPTLAQAHVSYAIHVFIILGSVVTGNFHVNSDIDLFVIVDQHRRQRRLFQLKSKDFLPPCEAVTPRNNVAYQKPIEQLQCEVFVNPVQMMIKEIEAREDPTVNAWRLGHVLYENAASGMNRPLGAADKETHPVSFLKQLAISTFKAGKPNCLSWDRFKTDSTRYFLMDGLLDAWDSIEAGDAASGSIMLSLCLSSALDVLYESRGWWGVKAKKRLLDLKENRLLVDIQQDATAEPTNRDATRALQLSRRIARNDVELSERYKSLKSLIALVVEPMGGEMSEWVTEWEDGSVCDDAPRKPLSFWVPAHMIVASCDLLTQSLGLYLFLGPLDLSCVSRAAVILTQASVVVGIVSQIVWFVALAQVFLLSSPVNFSTLEAADAWNKWLQFLCFGHSSSPHATRLRGRRWANSRGGGGHGDDSLLRSVARVFGDVLNDAETVVSDIFIGLIYVRHLQHKARMRDPYFTKIVSASSTSIMFAADETQHFEPVISKQPTRFSIPGDNNITHQACIPLSQISPKSFQPSTEIALGPTIALATHAEFTTEIREIIHFSEYAEAIYGLPLHMITNLSNFTRGLRMLCIPEACWPSHDTTPAHLGRVVDNVRNHLGQPGWPFCCVQERAPRDRHGDLVAISLENGLFRSPYLVCLDHEMRQVVVAIRGTMSTADVLVDLNCDLVNLTIPQETPEGAPAEPIRTKTHNGMLQTAMHIKQDITGLLEGLVMDPESEYRQYGIVVCGHSLGAGVATLLTHLLLTSPNTRHMPVKCYAYSPPGCITTRTANAHHFSRFVTSIVLGDDTVPRLNRRSVERLKRAVKRGVRKCRARKVDVVGGFVGAECFGVRRRRNDSGFLGDLDDVFGIHDDDGVNGMNDDGDAIDGGSAETDGGHVALDINHQDVVVDMDAEDEMLRVSLDTGCDEEVQIPGRVLHFRKERVFTHGDGEAGGSPNQGTAGAGTNSGASEEDQGLEDEYEGEEDQGSTVELNTGYEQDSLRLHGGKKGKRVYRAVWTTPDAFQDIVISSSMVSEHMPNVLGDVLRRCLKTVEESLDGDGLIPDVPYRPSDQ
ncbi:hypothetical protein HDU77_008349 [Chytriomyces hyalinus]|nr:hypothetical protein HDU77_008349 [Chytriomyces hyalinus]